MYIAVIIPQVTSLTYVLSGSATGFLILNKSFVYILHMVHACTCCRGTVETPEVPWSPEAPEAP